MSSMYFYRTEGMQGALLMSPHKAAAYLHRNKNDVNDADGIAEASSRPGMRFVGVKSVGQRHLQQLRRARQLAVKDRTAHANPLHGFLLEYGIESRKGIGALRRRLAEVLEDAENELPVEGRALLWDLGEELRRLDGRVQTFDAQIAAIGRTAGLPATGSHSGDRPVDGNGAGCGGWGRVGVNVLGFGRHRSLIIRRCCGDGDNPDAAFDLGRVGGYSGIERRVDRNVGTAIVQHQCLQRRIRRSLSGKHPWQQHANRYGQSCCTATGGSAYRVARTQLFDVRLG